MDDKWLVLLISSFVLVAGTVFYALEVPAVRNHRTWKAMVTPLSSIIGSGFLLATPLMYALLGKVAIFAMPVMMLLAYGVGHSLRFNIFYVEPLLVRERNAKLIRGLEILVSPALAFAYIVSVTYYLKLLSAFVMHSVGVEEVVYAKVLTTMLILVLSIIGRIDGLNLMEYVERYSVVFKMAIIAGLLAGLVVYNVHYFQDGFLEIPMYSWGIKWENMGKVLGVFVVVQGFETARYLGMRYSNTERVQAMRYAQFSTGTIFTLFALLTLPVSILFVEARATAVADVGMLLTPVIGYCVIVAAVLSQLGAAAADKVGGSALLFELSEGRLSLQNSFLLMGALAIVVTWSFNVFEVVSLASRAFAFYYCLQTVQSCLAVMRRKDLPNRMWKLVLFSFLSVCMLAITIFSEPAL